MSRQRFPNLAKVVLSVFETRIESILGKDAIQEIKSPVVKKQLHNALVDALSKAEERLIADYPDDEIIIVLGQLSTHSLESLKSVLWEFYENPKSTRLYNAVLEQIESVVPKDANKVRIADVATKYIRYFREEAALIPEISQKQNIISTMEIEHNTDRIANAVEKLLEILAMKQTISQSNQEPKNEFSKNDENAEDWISKEALKQLNLVSSKEKLFQDTNTKESINSRSVKYLIEYKNACEVLRKDISLAIRDYEYKKGDGRLLYAIDFSEIFAYIFPSENYRNFIIFPEVFDNEDQKIDDIALQQLVLHYILYELSEDEKLILLPPYAHEFKIFISSLQEKVFDELITQTIQVFNSFEKIINENLELKIENICRKLDTGGILSEDEEVTIENFVRKFGYILSVLEKNETDQHPYDRVKK